MGSATFDGKSPDDGYISYGAQLIDQRVPVAEQTDYMMDEASYLEVQTASMCATTMCCFLVCRRDVLSRHPGTLRPTSTTTRYTRLT